MPKGSKLRNFCSETYLFCVIKDIIIELYIFRAFNVKKKKGMKKDGKEERQLHTVVFIRFDTGISVHNHRGAAGCGGSKGR